MLLVGDAKPVPMLRDNDERLEAGLMDPSSDSDASTISYSLSLSLSLAPPLRLQTMSVLRSQIFFDHPIEVLLLLTRCHLSRHFRPPFQAFRGGKGEVPEGLTG